MGTCQSPQGPFTKSFFGAIASQEVLKAVTGLYQPVKPFLLYDCDEVLNVVVEKEEVDKQKGYLMTQLVFHMTYIWEMFVPHCLIVVFEIGIEDVLVRVHHVVIKY